MNTEDLITLSQYLRQERENEKESLKKCRQQMHVYKRSFDICSETIDFLFKQTSQKLPSYPQFATLLVMFRLLGSLQSIRTLALRGYYYEVNILARNFYESLGLCVYLKENPEKAEQWLKGKGIGISSIGLFNQVRRIFTHNTNDHLEKSSNRLYGYLCEYVHSHFFAHLHGLSVIFEQKEKIIDGKPAGSMLFRVPSELNEELMGGASLFAIAIGYGLLYLFKDDLPTERKLSLAKFLLRQSSKLY